MTTYTSPLKEVPKSRNDKRLTFNFMKIKMGRGIGMNRLMKENFGVF